MITTVLSVTREVNVLTEVPNGEYDGLWSGNEVSFSTKAFDFKLIVDKTLRGMNIPCKVNVSNGHIFVS